MTEKRCLYIFYLLEPHGHGGHVKVGVSADPLRYYRSLKWKAEHRGTPSPWPIGHQWFATEADALDAVGRLRVLFGHSAIGKDCFRFEPPSLSCARGTIRQAAASLVLDLQFWMGG